MPKKEQNKTESYIAVCMYNILAKIAPDKDFYIKLGYGQSPMSVDDIVGNVLKCLAENGNQVAITGKPE